ncbi:unnamed protein product [Camellia sinensis]
MHTTEKEIQKVKAHGERERGGRIRVKKTLEEMENLPHSVSKKSYNGNGNGVRPKTMYDDVFGGPPKLGGVPTLCPRVSDYTEIFSNFHASPASSIPILDLPPVNDADFSFDVRSSIFDYSQVFGGLNGVDFAASFEQLFELSKTTCDSSDEAWTPAQSESLSDESDPSASSDNLPNGESHQSCDGIKQISISYDKASQRSKEDGSSGMAHVTQLHAVPGFTSIVNESPSSEKIKDRNTPLQVADDINPKMDFSGGLRERKQFRKTMSHPSNRSFGIETLGTDLKPVGFGKSASHMNETFVTVSDISLRTQPSQLPPPSKPPHVLAVNGVDSGRHKSKLKASKSFAFGETTGDSSPSFFDVEVDPSSSAAVSAAAMKDVMEKAQAKLKSAKELMERKKDGLQSRTKFGLKNETKDKEGKASKTFDGFNSFKDERVHGTCQRDCSGMKTFVGEERKKVMKITQVVSDSIEGGKHINVAKISADKKNGKEDRSSQEFYKTEGTVAWREAAEFFELVEIDKSRKIYEQAKDESVLVQSTQSHECGQEKKAIPAFHQQEDDRKIKASRETCERDGNEGRSKATKESSRQEEHGKKVKVNQEVCKQEETGKKPRMVQQHGNIEKILTEAGKSEECDTLIEVQQKENQMKVEKKLKEANERIEDDKRHKDAHERYENERRLKQTLEMEKYEKRLEEAFELAEIEKRLEEALEQEEKEQQQREAFEKEEKEKRQKEACEREENEKRVKKAHEEDEKKRLKEALELEENEKILALMLEGDEKRLKMALEWQRNEKRLELDLEREENEKRLREDHRREEVDRKLKGAFELEENAKKQKEAHEREENVERLNEACEREGNEKRLKEAREQDENKKRLQEAHEREESEKRSEEAFKQKEIEKRYEDVNVCEKTEKRIEDVGYWEELKVWSKDHEQNERGENERKLNSDQGTCVDTEGENLKTSDDGACKLDDHENLQPGQAACEQDKNSGNVEMTKGNLSFEEDRTMKTEPIDSVNTRLEAVEVVNVLFEEKFNSSGMTLDYTQHEKNQINAKDVMKSHHLHDTVTESVEAGIGQTHIDRNKKAFKIASNPGTPNGLTHELGERGTNVKEVQVTFNKEHSKDKFMSSQVVGELIENGRKMGADQPTVLEGKRNAKSTGQKASTSKSTKRKEKNRNDILTPEEREKEERIKRERELEKDRLRKIEEEREREREREKDRMAVDRATLEARERTFAEAHDKAVRAAVERATAEVRQRAMTEARERLEKACAEARERSTGEKASMEARVRTERAAVERATAEARDRAFQKAMAEKAANERSVADKSFASYKNDGMRQSSSSSDLQDMQFQGIRSSSGSIYSYSSVHGASERFVGVEGESARRCKARLERHQRTAERAAKALAEKNMRDLIAQKEQAERNRFAEALDAEVKRWSGGKEGNLRALLSTLQYILGPDNGWRPIPLTEVITAAAVKKAYRKATLCVHPDKLQQRGASIQQKYICEKVFDLLKRSLEQIQLGGAVVEAFC